MGRFSLPLLLAFPLSLNISLYFLFPLSLSPVPSLRKFLSPSEAGFESVKLAAAIVQGKVLTERHCTFFSCPPPPPPPPPFFTAATCLASHPSSVHAPPLPLSLPSFFFLSIPSLLSFFCGHRATVHVMMRNSRERYRQQRLSPSRHMELN